VISWKTYLFVMLGGALGSALRMWLSVQIVARAGAEFPYGTLVVNVLGCLGIGACAACIEVPGTAAESSFARYFVMIGLLGGFTTFSSFSLQTWELLHIGEPARAGLNVLLSVVLCLTATWLGHVCTRAIIER
jgi:CrcB protein